MQRRSLGGFPQKTGQLRVTPGFLVLNSLQ